MESTLAVAAALTIAAAVTSIVFVRRGSRAGRVAAFARKVDLALDDQVDAEVGARLRNRESAGSAVGVLAAWSVVPLIAGEGTAGWEQYGHLVVLAAYFVGHALGYGIVAWRESARRARPGPRMARASVPSHADYLAPYERVGAWVVAGIGTATAVAVGVASWSGVPGVAPPFGLLAAVAVVPWALVVGDELLAKRLLQRPQVARTPLELAWDDALRARTLRDLAAVPIVVGYVAPLALVGLVSDRLEGGWPANPMVGVTSGAFALYLAAGLVMAVVSLGLNPQRHFRRRLWGTAPRSAAAAATGPEPGR